jgi:hypothetical protein
MTKTPETPERHPTHPRDTEEATGCTESCREVFRVNCAQAITFENNYPSAILFYGCYVFSVWDPAFCIDFNHLVVS